MRGPKTCWRRATAPICPRRCGSCATRAKTIAATFALPIRIFYPPEGARIDLGLTHGPEKADLSLKAQGGAPPFTWTVNGAPVQPPGPRHDARWKPDGAGFARVSVIDANGASDSVMVRLE